MNRSFHQEYINMLAECRKSFKPLKTELNLKGALFPKNNVKEENFCAYQGFRLF